MESNPILLNDQDEVYVVPNLVAECLVDNWYAWSHLINPATAALNVKNRHLKIMNSYIQSPQIHAMAIKNPKMLGGPFIDYDGKRVDEIKGLKENTLEACADLMELCDAINDLNKLLEEEANGYSMGPLYAKIPAPLRGLVELYYDLNNNPSFRFFEALLFRTKYYNEDLQSVNLFKVYEDDSRSFILSTPSLPKPDVLRLNIPFRSQAFNDLFKASRTPRPYGELKQLFDLQPEQEALFQTFFTKEAPAPYQRYEGEGVLTRYFGHACILVETKKTSILVDPVISYGYEADLSRYTYADLPDEIDYVLITHNHQDHVLFETLLQIRHKVKNVIIPRNNGGGLQDPSLKMMFEKIGYKNIIELAEMETLEFADCSISGLPFLGEHCDLDIRSKLCYLVDFHENVKVAFAADSCNLDMYLYERVQEAFGNIDVLFLGMECDGAPMSWLYGPLLPEALSRDKDQTRRFAGCNFDEARNLVQIFKPSNVFVYAMGMEPWLKYISSIKYTEESRPIVESTRLVEYCKSSGIEAERLYGEKIIEYSHQY